MDLHGLSIIHFPKNRAIADIPNLTKPLISMESVFYLETCQRWLAISYHASSPGHTKQVAKQATKQTKPAPSSLQDCLPKGSNADYYQGKDAYLFLLRLACGLESEILGETDVFGQIKEAWRKVESSQSPLVSPLGQWMQRIFEDTKEIRTRYLQNLGGTSYGTLVRKLIRDKAPNVKNDVKKDLKKPICLFGAGQIAHSIAPFLLDSDLWIWNRSPHRLASLHHSLMGRSRPNKTGEVLLLDDESKGWREAAVIVICTPFDSHSDAQKISWLTQRSDKHKDYTLIHLGGIREHSGEWQKLPQFYCLSDIFSLQNSIKNVRSVQITHAARACEEKAGIRTSHHSPSPCCLHNNSLSETLATFA